jgi:hypothetical protein
MEGTGMTFSKIYTGTLDRTGWGSGPWDDEPDKAQWVDEQTDLDCLIVRNHFGVLCGYVGVPRTHPAYGQPYEHLDVDVHGGLTYGAPCRESEDPAFGICHVPEPGREHDIWWFGFDTGHFMDLQPGMEAMFAAHGLPSPSRGDMFPTTYKTIDYVTRECQGLALQLAEQAEP